MMNQTEYKQLLVLVYQLLLHNNSHEILYYMNQNLEHISQRLKKNLKPNL